MTKAQQAVLFKKIDRGIQSGALAVIETAKRTNTPIVISCPEGKIKKLSPAEAKRALKKKQNTCSPKTPSEK